MGVGLLLLVPVPASSFSGHSPSPLASPGPSPLGPGCPSKVMAFYYGWYGGPPDYRHWANATGQPQYQYQPPATLASAHYPALGPYGSHDGAVADRHLRWAEDAGIDTLISSWWGPGSYEDASLSLLLDRMAATRTPVKASAYLETWALFHGSQFGADFFTDPDNFSPAGRQAIRDKAAAWITYLVNTHGNRESFQHVTKNGREVPVVFVYTAALLDPLEWQQVFAQVRAGTGTDVFYDGDVEGADAQAQARAFDGLHVYTPVHLTAEGDLSLAARMTDPGATVQSPVAPVTDPVTAGGDYQAWSSEARALGRTWSATVVPGFDDRKVRNPSFWVSRAHGDQLTYDEFWQLSLRSRPDWVLITSFNEWHEGTEIEPSSEYGDRFLERTRHWADQTHRHCQG